MPVPETDTLRTDAPEITIIVGTNRNQAYSQTVARYYQQVLADKGVASQILNLSALPEDFIATALYENSGKNPAFNKFAETVAASDKFVFIVPEYNGSFPGVLKAFIDGLEYPSALSNKKCALVGLSAGMQGGAIALSHLTDVLNYLGMHVLALKPSLAYIQQHLKDGHITNKIYTELLDTQASQLIDF